MSETATGNGDGSGVEAVAAETAVAEPPREKLTKKAITADQPTWCPGCGDFAVLAAFYNVLEKRNLEHEKIVTLGAIDQPVNPMKKLIAGGATFIARTHAANVTHMIQLIERAMDHQGFSVIECLSECVEFFPDVFDPANPKKGGSFELIQEKKWDNTPEDELRHDVTDELAAYKLAQLPFPGVFGVFYETDRPTKNSLEKKWIETTRDKTGNANDLEVLQKTFDKMK